MYSLLLFLFILFLLLIVKIVITRKGRKDSIMTLKTHHSVLRAVKHSAPCFEMGFNVTFNRSRYTQWICMFWKDSMFMPVSGLVCVCASEATFIHHNFKSFLGQSRFSLNRNNHWIIYWVSNTYAALCDLLRNDVIINAKTEFLKEVEK